MLFLIFSSSCYILHTSSCLVFSDPRDCLDCSHLCLIISSVQVALTPSYHFCCLTLFTLSVFIATLSIVCLCVYLWGFSSVYLFPLHWTASLLVFVWRLPVKFTFISCPLTGEWGAACFLSTGNICAWVPKPCMYQSVQKKYTENTFSLS